MVIIILCVIRDISYPANSTTNNNSACKSDDLYKDLKTEEKLEHQNGVPSTFNNISFSAAMGSHKIIYGFLSGAVSYTYCVLDVDGIFRSLYAGRTLAII